ncbi:MAG TPA: ACP phosphodiesterase [Cyclobacteriaceae bacterium]|nr:ACP phosphodiesterase [Cyclobacteriaceae bacterium]
MNFLAHGYLSRHSESLLLGNFIGDFVKGRNMDHFAPEIVRGIRMHRNIDEFTDSHPVFIRSKNRIREKYRHYTGVIIDVFYDHFLAANWKDYNTEEDLPAFCDKLYNIISVHYDMLPDAAKEIIPWMKKYNWLLNYATIEGIDRSLKGMSRRTPFKSGMEYASGDLRIFYREFSEDFNEFFPDLMSHTRVAFP